MWPSKKKTLIMGILNITPDSFSDGGTYQNLDEIIKRAKQMVEDGADIIDVGGESTRPGSTVVTLEEELNRVIPVIKRLVQEVEVPISVDTYKAEVARQAVEAGASIINDIGGAKFDPLMPEVMAQSGAYVILMHNRKPDMSQTDCITTISGELTQYDDIVETVRDELKESIELVKAAGVSDDKIIIDPGIGFAKTVDKNIELMQRVSELHDLGYPILLGVSKKGSIGHLLGGLDVNNRAEGTMAATCFAVSQEIEIVRVHDVLENARAAKVMQQLLNYV
ncbi:MAG: dihydropteroate synthase [Turicibacter sp.]|nr:dihydropteroate synthase [Turicibacter sp.]